MHLGASEFICHTEFNCPSGGTNVSASSVNECCFDKPGGMSYSFLGQCVNCFSKFNTPIKIRQCTSISFMLTAYGFAQPSLVEVERGQGYSFDIGYLKSPPGSTGFTRGSIIIVHNTTSEWLLI